MFVKGDKLAAGDGGTSTGGFAHARSSLSSAARSAMRSSIS
jgi:hypothetical protein